MEKKKKGKWGELILIIVLIVTIPIGLGIVGTWAQSHQQSTTAPKK